MAMAGKIWSLLLAFSAVLITTQAGNVVPPPTLPANIPTIPTIPTIPANIPTIPANIPTIPANIPTIPTSLTDFSGLDLPDDLFKSKFDIDGSNEGVCGEKRGFPIKTGDYLESSRDFADFALGIRDSGTQIVFGRFLQKNPIIDLTQMEQEDVREFLESIVDHGEDLLKFTSDFTDMLAGEGFKQLVHFVVDRPEMMRVFKKQAVEHVLANLTMEDLEELCENLDQSDLSEIRVSEIIRDFPQCVDVAQRHAQEGTSLRDTQFQHGRVIVDRIRSAGLKLNASDFLLDPGSITVEDVDGLKEDDIMDARSLKSLSKVADMMDQNVISRLAERVSSELGEPSTWDPEMYEDVGKIVMHLPDDSLQGFVDDNVLEIFLNSDLKLNKRIVAFMIESLYAKRNEPNFHKRFCLSVFHHPYITVAMLDDFTPRELWDALRQCPPIFHDMAYAYADDYYYEDYDDEDEEDEEFFRQDWDPEHAFDGDVVEMFMEELKPRIMQLRPLMRMIFSDRSVRLNETELREFGVFLPAAPAHVFENLPTKLLMKAWPQMQRLGKFPVKTLDVVMHKFDPYLPEPENANASTAQLLGQALLVLPCGTIDAFPGRELLRFVLSGYFRHNEYFSCEINERLCQSIARKALRDSPGNLRKLVVQNLGKLGEYLDMDDFKDDEIFFNDYLPDYVERDMFKRKEKDEKEKASRDDSKFDLSDEEKVLDAFVKEGGKTSNKDKGPKMSYEEGLFTKALKQIGIPPNFTDFSLGRDSPPKRFNLSYLEKNFTDFDRDFSLRHFGDIEDFMGSVMNISFDDVLDMLMGGFLDPESLEFGDEEDDGFFSVNEDFLENIPENEDSLDFLKSMKTSLKSKAGKNGGSVDQKQLTSGFKVVKKMFQMDGNKTDICLDDTVIESIDCYFTSARKHELEQLSNRTRKAILKAEGNNVECAASMSPDQIHQHFESFLEVDDELREATEWDEDLLMRSGPAMLCGMEESHVAKLKPQAAARLSGQLCNCRQLSAGARKAIFNKIKEHYKNDISNVFKPPYNTDVASCMMYAPPEDLRGMTQNAKKIFIAMASRFLDEVHDHLQQIEDMGYFGVEDLVEEQLQAEELANAVWMIMDEMDVPALDRLSHLSQFKSVINVDFLDELSDVEFEDALDYLQDNDEWTDGQKGALSGKIDKVFGGVGNLSDVDFLKLGGLLSARLDSSDDFEEIDFDECTMDFVLDKFADNEDLFESICEKLTLENAMTTIKKKPQAICCLEMKDAKDLNATFIMEGIDMMGGKCHPCLKKRGDLLSEFAKIVSRELMGMENNESLNEILENLKCLAGKMPEDFLDLLPAERFDRFDAEAIELMDPEVFCKVAKKDFLKSMTSAQSDAIDGAKLECLDNEKFNAFWETIDGSTEEYHYDEDEVFLDFSERGIGDAEEFDDYLRDLAAPITQSGSGGGNVQCVSPRGENFQGMTDDGKQKMRGVLSGDQLTLFNEWDVDSNIDFDRFSEADIVNLVEEVDSTFDGMSVGFKKFISDLPTMVKDLNVGDNDDILQDVFENMDPQVYTMIEPTFLCNSLRQLKEDHLEKLCGRLLKEDVSTQTFITVSTQCPVCFTYWIQGRRDEKLYSILGKETAAVFFGLRLRDTKPLDLEILALGPKGITPDIIKAVDPKSFGSVSQLTALSHPNVAKNIPKNSIKLIIKRIVKEMGEIKKWSSVLKSRLQFFIFQLSRQELQEQLKPSDVIEIIMSRDGGTEGLEDPKVRKILGQSVNKYIMKNSQTLDKDVLESPQVFCLLLSSGIPKKLLGSYDTEFLLEMASQCSEFYDISQSAARSFNRAILRNIPKNEENLGKMKHVLNLFPPKDIAGFSKSDLKTVWSEVKDQDFDEPQLRKFWDAIKDDITNFDCTDFNTLGQLLRVVPRSAIETATGLFDCLDDVMEAVERDGVIDKALARGLWKMVKTKLAQDSTDFKDFIMSNDFPAKLASIIPKSEYDRLNLDFEDRAVREKAFQIAENIGDEKSDLVANLFKGLDLDDPEIQEHVLENDDVARVVFSYMDDDALGLLQSGDSEGSMLEELAGDVEGMTNRDLERNFGLMKKRINMTADCEIETVCMDEGQAWVLGPLFVGARPNEIECFTETTRKVIIESIGQNTKLCRRMTSAVIQKLFSFVNPIKALEDGEDLEILYGCMVCGFTKSQIEALTDEQVVSLQDVLSGCRQFGNDVKEVITNKVVSSYGGFDEYLEANPDVGTYLMNMPVNDIEDLSGDALEIIGAALNDITLELKDEIADKIERIGRREIDGAELTQYMETYNKILKALYEHLIGSSSSTRRRKRAAPDSDEQCDTLSTFNGNLCFLTENQINALSDQTVADCASEFQGCDFSESVFTLLATKAKTALGAVSDWETNDYASLGVMLGYMGDTTISEMELTDDVMSVLPNVDMENGDDIIEQYLAHNSKEMSDLTGENIADYSLLLGSVDDEKLNKLEPAAVAEAASTYDLGGNDALDDDVVLLFTNKLIEAGTFNFTDASSSDIANLGLLAGKLPENVLSELSTDQKSGISAEAIKLIDAEVLASSFTPSDFAAMTSDQANALSADQLNQLSSDQRTVVSAISTTVLDGEEDGSGRASTMSVSLGLLLASIVLTLWAVRMD